MSGSAVPSSVTILNSIFFNALSELCNFPMNNKETFHGFWGKVKSGSFLLMSLLKNVLLVFRVTLVALLQQVHRVVVGECRMGLRSGGIGCWLLLWCLGGCKVRRFSKLLGVFRIGS